MPTLLFTCPTKRKQVSSGIKTDAQSLQAVWSKDVQVNCPLCGEVHAISVRETFLQAALDDGLARVVPDIHAA